MKPIPVAFHIGPLEVHTYGIGLAITFWFAYRYFDRRLEKHGYRTDWVTALFLWVIVSAVVGARAAHVLANFGYYSHNPSEILAIWHGGLSSFGGLILAVPTGILVAWRRCPELRIARALDLVAPVLMVAWAMGRLLGPQLMVRGGGHPSHQWFCMYYATQPGCRLPVPVFQAIEDFTVFCVLIYLERRLDRWPDGSARANYPTGLVIGTGMALWGIERTLDQHLWLSTTGPVGNDLVQLAGLALFVTGIVVVLLARRRWRAWLLAGAPGGHLEEGAADGVGEDGGPAGGEPPGTGPGGDGGAAPEGDLADEAGEEPVRG
jgi:phosphatidylglycerol:prolipoprotein diacylglycerol transferase